MSPAAADHPASGPFLHTEGYLYDSGSPVASSDRNLGLPDHGSPEPYERPSQDSVFRESTGQVAEAAYYHQGSRQSHGRPHQRTSIESLNAAPGYRNSRIHQESQDAANHASTSGGALAASPDAASLPVPMEEYIPQAGACMRAGQSFPTTETLPDAAAAPHFPHTGQSQDGPSHQQARHHEHAACDDLQPGDPRGSSPQETTNSNPLHRAAERPGAKQAVADGQGSDGVQQSHQARPASADSSQSKPIGWDGDDWGWGVDGLTGLGIPAKGSTDPQPHTDAYRNSAEYISQAGNASGPPSDAVQQGPSDGQHPLRHSHAGSSEVAGGSQRRSDMHAKPGRQDQAGSHAKGDFPDILNLGGDLLQQVGLPGHCLLIHPCNKHDQL